MSKRTAVPSAQPAFLPTTKGMAPWTRSSEMSEAVFPLPPGRSRARRTSCSCTQLSKTRTVMNSACGTSPTGLQPRFGPLRRRQGVQLGQPRPGDLDELRSYGGAGSRPAHGDEALVGGREFVLDVLAEGLVPLRNRLAHDRLLYPDEVRKLILDVPAGALGGHGPLLVRQLEAHLGQRPPRLGQRVADRIFPAGASHRPDLHRCRSRSRPYPRIVPAVARPSPILRNPPTTFDSRSRPSHDRRSCHG